MNSRSIKILGSVIIAVIAILGVVIIVVPLVNSIQASPDIVAAQQRNQQLQSQAQKLQQAKSQEPAVTKLRSQLLQQYPQAANVPELINLISVAAESSGIPATNITSFTFSAPALGGAASGAPAATPAPAATGTGTAAGSSATGQYATLGVNLTVLGTNRQFATFMSNLTSMDRVYSISNFSIAVANNSSTLTLTGNTYLYKEVATPNAAASTAATSAAQ